MPLSEVRDFTARIENGVLVYEFTMPLPEPIDPGASQFAAGSYDPEYYVEVLLDEDDPVRFEGGCRAAPAPTPSARTASTRSTMAWSIH